MQRLPDSSPPTIGLSGMHTELKISESTMIFTSLNSKIYHHQPPLKTKKDNVSLKSSEMKSDYSTISNGTEFKKDQLILSKLWIMSPKDTSIQFQSLSTLKSPHMEDISSYAI